MTFIYHPIEVAPHQKKQTDELDANGSISWTRRIQNTSKNQFRYAEISEQNYLSLFAMRYLLMLKSIRLIVADPTIHK